MNREKPIIINLFGAPGSGKSTGAARIFSDLKLVGMNAELTTEFAKDKVWEENKEVFNNQIYIFGKQLMKITRLHGKVDFIVTDSPLLLSSYYNSSNNYKSELDNLILKVFDSYPTMNYFINRVKPYNPMGRFQDEAGSNEINIKMKLFLDNLSIPYVEVNGDIEGYYRIFQDAYTVFKDRQISEMKRENVCKAFAKRREDFPLPVEGIK